MYSPLNIPEVSEESARLVAEWTFKEFIQIERGFGLQDFVQFKVWNTPPLKPREGLTVMADGTNWNPGGGKGVYTFYNSVWNKLG